MVKGAAAGSSPPPLPPRSRRRVRPAFVAAMIAGVIIAVLVMALPWIVSFAFQPNTRLMMQFGPSAEKISSEQMAAMSLVREEERLSRLISLPAGPGNAALDIWGSVHQLDNFDGWSHMPYEWFPKLTWGSYWGSIESSTEEQWRLIEHSLIPELDDFRAAASKKDYEMWGKVIVPADYPILTAQKVPLYNDVSYMIMLGMVRARELDREGKTREALEWYHDLLRISNLLERDIYWGQWVGIMTKIELARELVSRYMRQGDPGAAARWFSYWEEESKRKDALAEVYWRLYNNSYCDADMEKIYSSPEVSPGLAMAAYNLMLYRACFRSEGRVIVGPSAADRERLLDAVRTCPALAPLREYAACHLQASFNQRAVDMMTYLQEKNYWYTYQ